MTGQYLQLTAASISGSQFLVSPDTELSQTIGRASICSCSANLLYPKRNLQSFPRVFVSNICAAILFARDPHVRVQP